MRYFPLFLDLEDGDVAVIGGGEQAAQKLRLLLKSPAKLRVYTQSPNHELQSWANAGRLTIVDQPFAISEDTDQAKLIFVAIDDRTEIDRIVGLAKIHAIPVNVVDRPDVSSFVMPAIIDRDPVTVAIGTEGTAPVLARQIKSRIETWLPSNLGRLAKMAASVRGRVAGALDDPVARRRLWERLINGPYRNHVLKHRDDLAEAELQTALDEIGSGNPAGHVTLVGCGPGDPDLLTLKAVQAMQAADTLVYDRLVDPKILEYARRDAKRIYVGKAPGQHSISQDGINRILVREGLKGRKIARLKGGDPLVFARAAEEIAVVRAAGLSVDIIPGISAAHAAAAQIALPLTLRNKVRRFSILTGATADQSLEHDWAALANSDSAFAIYMGIRSAPDLQASLLDAGADPSMPIVIVENASRADEQAVETTLADMSSCISAFGLTGPAIIFGGLSWEAACLTRPETVHHYAPQLTTGSTGPDHHQPTQISPAPAARTEL